jgi:hypothetical protein
MRELNERAPESKATPLGPHQGRATTRRKGGLAKRRGRLDREVLAKLGKGLKDCFADVQNQEVPERFKILLRQF